MKNILDLSYINKCLLIFIKIRNKNNLHDINEFKKLVISSNFKIIKFVEFYIKKPNIKYYIGLGKLIKLKYFINKYNLFFVLFNVILKNSQEINLKKFLNCRIFDINNIILNIFRIKAKTYFGKLQVELAYLNYLSTRLVNKWSHLERQRGNIKNISGPGEKQIEIDKRIIKNKINNIKKKLFNIKNQKIKSNKLRIKSNFFTISLVGYTNSGKSTLFNLLTNSKLDIENKFFTTLDTYIKRFKNKFNINKILISDTIGFIKNLPKELFNSFESTLEEINNSDLIFHIVDFSNYFYKDNLNVVNNILKRVLNKKIPIVYIMNKIDKLYNFLPKLDFKLRKIWISAKYKLGINFIIKYIDFFFKRFYKIFKFFLPFNLNNNFNSYLYKNNYIYRKIYLLNNYEKYYIYLKMTNIEFNNLLKIYPFILNYMVI